MNFNGRVGLVTQLLPVPQGPVGSPTIKSLPLQAALQCSNVCLSSVRYPGGQTFVHIASGKATQQPLGSIKSGTDDQHTRVWMDVPGTAGDPLHSAFGKLESFNRQTKGTCAIGHQGCICT